MFADAERLGQRFPSAWPDLTYELFCWAAGMVQSRTFHLRASNWVTNEETEGAPRFETAAVCAVACVAFDGEHPAGSSGSGGGMQAAALRLKTLADCPCHVR